MSFKYYAVMVGEIAVGCVQAGDDVRLHTATGLHIVPTLGVMPMPEGGKIDEIDFEEYKSLKITFSQLVAQLAQKEPE